MVRTVVAAAVAAVAVAAAAAPVPAAADVVGTCRVVVDGVDAGGRSAAAPGDAVRLRGDAAMTVEVSAVPAGAPYRVDVEVAGRRLHVAEGTSGGNGWSRDVAVGDHSWLAVGLYRFVISTGTGDDRCVARVLVDVQGSPLQTAAGAASAVAVVGGAGLVAGATVRARRRRLGTVGVL